MTAPGSRFLDVETMSRLARLRFRTRHKVDGARMGRHASASAGGAAEFADFREYAPGDDLRRLDWKVLARSGRAVLRTYQDEMRLSATLVLDASRSMLFGGKLDFARSLIASLAFVIAAAQDEVGLAVVGEELADHLPAGAAPGQLQSVLDRLEQVQPAAATGLARGLDQLFAHTARRGVLVVVSDWLDGDLGELQAALRRYRHRHFAVVCVHVIHPDELALPDHRACRFVALEGAGEVVTDPRSIARGYAERFEAFAESVKGMALSCGSDYHRVITDGGPLLALERLVRGTGGRRR